MKAVVLKTFPYQESGRIAHLYAEQIGLISLLVKRISLKNNHLINILSPLSCSDFQISKRKSDLYHFQDATLLDPFIELRNNLDSLTAAGVLAKLILATQSHCRPSPPLFSLLITYLNALKTTSSPRNYSTSFLLKLLRLEGLFPHSREDFPLQLGEDEWEAVSLLAYATSHEAIANAELPTQIEEKIHRIVPDLFAAL